MMTDEVALDFLKNSKDSHYECDLWVATLLKNLGYTKTSTEYLKLMGEWEYVDGKYLSEPT